MPPAGKDVFNPPLNTKLEWRTYAEPMSLRLLHYTGLSILPADLLDTKGLSLETNFRLQTTRHTMPHLGTWLALQLTLQMPLLQRGRSLFGLRRDIVSSTLLQRVGDLPVEVTSCIVGDVGTTALASPL
jgi:hypothetical protein